MRLRSDYLTSQDIIDALNAAKGAGQIPAHVHFDVFRVENSRTHRYGYEIHLGSFVKDRDITGKMRRMPSNSKDRYSLSEFTATYAEWGWFIAFLYEIDDTFVFGPYKNRHNFQGYTRYAFIPADLATV